MFSAHIEKHEEEVEHEKNEERLLEEDFGDTLLGALRSYFWDMLEYPETSPAAQAMATISMMFVVMSTVTFLLESNLEQENDILFAREGMNTTTTAFNATSFTDKERKIVLTITQIIDNLAITFFTAEYFARLILSPNKRKFVFNKMNMVDLLAIVPFYLALVLEGLEDMEIIGKAGKIVRLVRFVPTSTRYCVLMLYFINRTIPFCVFRIMRILRIFKMVRHFVGLQSLVYTLHQAYKDLGLILIIISVTVLMFSSLVFAFEQDSKKFSVLYAHVNFWRHFRPPSG